MERNEDLNVYFPRKIRLHEHLEVDIAPEETSDFTNFHTLNISGSGALIASYKPVILEKNQIMQVCIDPWMDFLPKAIICKGKVARTVKPWSKGIKKYITMRGEDLDIATIVGIQFCDVSPYNLELLEFFIAEQLKQAA